MKKTKLNMIIKHGIKSIKIAYQIQQYKTLKNMYFDLRYTTRRGQPIDFLFTMYCTFDIQKWV